VKTQSIISKRWKTATPTETLDMKLKALLIAITLAAAVGQANAAYDLPSAGNGPLILTA
jgi:hypothetical protein